MTDAHTVLDALKTTVDESDRLPQSTTYSTWEVDQDGGQADLRPPIVEFTIIDTVRSTPHNTDFVEFATDQSGNHIGRIYNALFEMSVQIDVWTAEGDRYDPYELGEAVRRAIYRHDAYGLDEPLPDPSDPSQDLGDVDRVTVGDGNVANDLTMTPALRRWRQTVDVWFHETVNTAEEYGEQDYIVDVVTPSDGDMESGTDVEIVYDATPSTESTTDQYT